MTREEYQAAEDVVYLAACMVNGENPDAERVSGMRLPSLYTFADHHLLTGIVGYALEAAGIRDAAFIQAKGKAIRRAVLFDAERAAVLREFGKAGIWHMPLKGCVLKTYYPKIGMRQMADNDILYDASRSGDVRTIMEGLGFRTVSRAQRNYGEDIFDKEPVCHFEMHRALFSPRIGGAIYGYYRNIREKMIRDEESGYGYHLSPEDFYIFIIAHEYKHYLNGGTGLRSLLDIYVYLRKESLDMAYVAEEAGKLGLTDFEAFNRSFARHLFGGDALTGEERQALEYILSSGAHGTMKHSVENQVARRGRLGYVLSRITLPYDGMVQIYPALGKAPLLYPFCWAHRLIHAFIFKRQRFTFQLKTALARKKPFPRHERKKNS